MVRNYKNIHIGKHIHHRLEECSVSITHAAKFLKVEEEVIEEMFESKTIDVVCLLRWSKLLSYDFFRIYSQHLILYAPQDKKKGSRKDVKSTLPQFKKNIYTPEIIMYLIELVDSGQKTAKELQDEYNIASTTVFRWINKYSKKHKQE